MIDGTTDSTSYFFPDFHSPGFGCYSKRYRFEEFWWQSFTRGQKRTDFGPLQKNKSPTAFSLKPRISLTVKALRIKLNMITWSVLYIPCTKSYEQIQSRTVGFIPQIDHDLVQFQVLDCETAARDRMCCPNRSSGVGKRCLGPFWGPSAI